MVTPARAEILSLRRSLFVMCARFTEASLSAARWRSRAKRAQASPPAPPALVYSERDKAIIRANDAEAERDAAKTNAERERERARRAEAAERDLEALKTEHQAIKAQRGSESLALEKAREALDGSEKRSSAHAKAADRAAELSEKLRKQRDSAVAILRPLMGTTNLAAVQDHISEALYALGAT